MTEPLPPEGVGAAPISWLARRLLARLPRRLTADVGAFGLLTLELEGAAGHGGLAPEHVAFGLGHDRIEGRLELDAALAHRIVGVALGRELEVSVERLGVGARGVLAGFVASALYALGAPLTLALAAPERATLHAAGAVALAVRVSTAGGAGWARLDVPPNWLARAARVPADMAAIAAFTIDASVELARTTLTAGELAAVGSGDAVVFDGVPSVGGSAEDLWPARLVVGPYAADARLTGDATVVVEREFDRELSAAAGGRPRPEEDVLIDTDAPSRVVENLGAAGGLADATALLTSAPVQVVAELARLRLRGDEVLGLGPGAVFRLGGPRDATVALRAGGLAWAEGVLVDVDGELGVRVTTAPHPPAR